MESVITNGREAESATQPQTQGGQVRDSERERWKVREGETSNLSEKG